MNLWLLGEGWDKGIVKEFGIDINTLLCSKWITNKDQDGRGVWGSVCVCTHLVV